MKLLVSWFERASRSKVSVPRWYGRSYSDHSRAYDIYYPIPLNYITRYSLRFYWRAVRALDWVGLFDTPEAVEMQWSDFWRIKTH